MSLMERYLRFLLRRRVVVLAVLVALTAASVWVLGRGVLATSLGALFLGDDPDYEVYKDRVLELGGDTVVLVGYEDEELLSRDSLDRLERATARIRAMPDVARVESLLDASRIHGADGMVRITRYAEEARRHPERAPALLADLTQDPLYRDLLVTADGRHAAVLVELPVDDSRPVEREPLIVEEVLQAFRDEGFPAERLHRTGIVSLMAELMHQAQLNLTRIFPATALVLLLVVWLMFRRLWPALITTGVGAISVLWTMALAVLLDPNINIMVALVPAVMLIVSFSDVIHLCSAYLLEAGRCPTRDEAILRAGVDVGRACYYTSITTFAGFISMIFIPAPVFRTLGIVLASGVAMALLLALTLTPVLFSLMPRPRAWKSEGSRVLRAVDSFLGVVRELTLARPWRVVALFAILGAAALAGSLAVTIDTSFEDRLRDDNPVSRDSAWFEERFSGAATLDLYVDAPEGGTLLEPGLLAAVARWQDRVEAEEGVDRALSLVTVLREIHRAMDPGRPPGELPEDPRRLADYMLLLEMSGDDVGLDRLVTHGRETLRVGVRLAQGTPVREAHALGRRLEALAADLLPAGVRIEASGSLVLTGRWLERIVDGQRRGLGFAFLSILVMMIMALRSVRAGLWSMVPNVLPLFALGALCALLWERTDSDALAVAMIALGIGVDDTIHFLTRLRLEVTRSPNLEEAIRRTFHFSGRAIVITTAVLVAGFAPFILSDYLTVRFFGTLLPFTLIVALAADVVLVPAMARLGVFQGAARRHSSGHSGATGA